MTAKDNKIMTPVKIGLPSLVVYADHLHISSLLLNNTDSAFPSVVVEYVEFTDVFGQKFRSESFYIPPAGASHFVNCDIPTGKEPYLKKSHIEISLLTSTGVKYSVLFACETHYNPKCTFVSSDTRQMTSEEQAFSSKIFQVWFKQQGTKLPIGGSAGAKPPAVDTTLEQLRKAVFTEMYYLKNNGGRQYKVSSGKFICKMNSLYAYQFEMESEVYLADDSPVKVSCVAGSAEGTVLLCDGFEILLLLESDLGSSISSGSISVEPWKLLESLNKKIENISDLGPVARQFLYEGPSLATKLPSTHIPKGQELAKEHALNSPITVIWGPPGTGKTHTMSEIAISLLKKGKTVLLVSHSNVSVDGVAAKIASLLRAQKQDQYLKDGKVDWLNMKQTTVDISTHASYRSSVISFINPYFNQKYPQLRLCDVSAKHIQDYYSYEMRVNKVSANTVKHQHACISNALRYAVRMDIINGNPAAKVELPRLSSYAASYYNETELKKLFELVKGTPLELGVFLASYYGLRRSEIVGLRWDAIDFDRKTISINHTATEVFDGEKVQLVLKDRTKTKSSHRMLPLVEPFEKLLLELRETQKVNRKLCGNCYCTDYLDYIYVNELGELMKPGYLTAKLPEILEENGMRRIRFHDLRHSCASLLLANGVSLKDIQAWLGHSTISTTANIYVHQEFTSKINSANAILQLLPMDKKESEQA